MTRQRLLRAAQDVERLVLRHLHDPTRRVGGDTVIRPIAHCLDDTVLHHVLSQLEVLEAEDTGQRGNHLPRLVAEQVVNHLGYLCGRAARLGVVIMV